mmetsp:Transcript_69758/g.166496  ORF Transcript_69758/g.166496 Transcript_69758/m.166496 type:complete len:310 (-) Transcript_69758:92-1021(-)
MLRREPPEDRHACRMQGGWEGGHGLRWTVLGLRRWQRRPKGRELRLARHVGQCVDLVLRVDPHQPQEVLFGFGDAAQEHADPALGLQEPDLVYDLRLILRHALESFLVLPGFFHDGGLVQMQLRVLIVRHVGVLLLKGVLVVVDAGPRELVALAEMLGDGIAHPVQPVVGLHLQEFSSGLREARDISAMDLEQGEISEDLDVVRVVLQSLAIALHRLVVVAVLPVQQAKDVPADVASQVALQALLHKLVGLFLSLQVADNEALHAKGLPMVRVLLEDGVCCFHTLLVLLRLIKLHDGAEHRLIFRWKRL